MTFEPEMGQIAFSNSEWFGDEAPREVMDAVSVLGWLVVGGPHELGGTITDNPCGNVAAAFRNDTFAIRSYCWCDGARHPDVEDGGEGCPPNFHHYASGFRVSWYKDSLRGQSCNMPMNVWGFLPIFEDCVASLRRNTGMGT